MSEQNAAGVSRVIMPTGRGDLAESVLLSVAVDLTRAIEALGYPTLQAMLGEDVPIAQVQHSLMKIACAVTARYSSYIEKAIMIHASGESGASTRVECRQDRSR